MQPFERTLPTPAENLALDEALLEWAEETEAHEDYLRLWESPEPMVVVGRSSRVEQEVETYFCRSQGIPVLRRSSGGAAIVAGPGCLMYAVVLSYARHPELRDITRAHAYILKQLTTALAPVVATDGTVACGGTSDLVLQRGTSSEEQEIGSCVSPSPLPTPNSPLYAPVPSLLAPQSSLLSPRKFSGNSLRVKRTHLLYHGTLLYDFDLTLIAKCLRTAPRQPEYRKARPHNEFVTNIPATREQLANGIIAAFPTARPSTVVPDAQIEALVAERFGNDEWNFERM